MLDEVTLILPPSPIKHQGQTFDLRVIFEGKLPTSLLFNATTLNGRVTMVLTVHEPLYTCWYTILYEYGVRVIFGGVLCVSVPKIKV